MALHVNNADIAEITIWGIARLYSILPGSVARGECELILIKYFSCVARLPVRIRLRGGCATRAALALGRWGRTLLRGSLGALQNKGI